MKKKQIEFNNLPFVDKALMVTSFGEHIVTINHCGYEANLFSIGGEYVEVMYNVQSGEFDYIGLAHYLDLNKYCNAINIDTLIRPN